jgi:hypothetical protein
MLFKNTVFEADNIGGDPGGGPSHPSEAAMRYDVITFCNDELVLQMFRCGPPYALHGIRAKGGLESK